MAVAGKVAITLSTENGGSWSADVTYDRLVAVKHNNNLYISRKTVTNVEPPNDEFWFLALEGFSGDDIEDIINGTTQVGNAKTLDGHGAEYFAPLADLKNGTTQVGKAKNLVGDFVNGSIKDYALNLTMQTKSYVLTDTNTTDLPVSGRGVVEFNRRTYDTWVTYFCFENNTIYTTEYDANIGAWYPWKQVATLAELADYLPLTGGTLSNTTAVPFVVNNTTSGATETRIGYIANGSALGYLGFNGADTPTMFTSSGVANTLLHTGNMADYVLPKSGGKLSTSVSNPLILESTTTDSTNIAFDGASGILGHIGFVGADTPAVWNSDSVTWHKLLHTGNKPTGTYTGNGSDITRAISTGGIGSVCVVYSSIGYSIVTDIGRFNPDGSFSNEASFVNGVLYIASTSNMLNASGTEYKYAVL